MIKYPSLFWKQTKLKMIKTDSSNLKRTTAANNLTSLSKEIEQTRHLAETPHRSPQSKDLEPKKLSLKKLLEGANIITIRLQILQMLPMVIN